MTTVERLLRSFADAGRGVVYVFKKEQNFRLQIFAGLIVFVTIFVLPLRSWETIVLILMVVMVLTMELLNTALENFTDLFKPRIHPYVGIIKDIMAAAVLITALGALVIGSIIIYPHFIGLLK
ncbi:MAG: diacylglycerol kinase [Patescibacteria group bacterium]|jgi:diacylglycerol kinase